MALSDARSACQVLKSLRSFLERSWVEEVPKAPSFEEKEDTETSEDDSKESETVLEASRCLFEGFWEPTSRASVSAAIDALRELASGESAKTPRR